MNKIIIQGIKFDENSSYQKGPALAPALIREALNCGSMNLFAENGKKIDDEVVKDMGDFAINEYLNIEEITDKHLNLGNKIFSLGGDHSITFPIIKAFHKKHTQFDILHIDAHSDLYDSYEDNRYSHACPFARIMEGKLTNKLIQVGIRTLNTHQLEQAERFNVEVHQMKDLDMSKIRDFKNPLYISLDMDSFDPAFAPGVSHHEPGGLTAREVIGLIQSIDVEIIGADIVEYNPKRDCNNMTSFLAAKMMKEIISKMI